MIKQTKKKAIHDLIKIFDGYFNNAKTIFKKIKKGKKKFIDFIGPAWGIAVTSKNLGLEIKDIIEMDEKLKPIDFIENVDVIQSYIQHDLDIDGLKDGTKAKKIAFLVAGVINDINNILKED